MKKLKLIAVIFVLSTNVFAGSRGLHLGVQGMLLSSSTEQGGSGPKGSTVLTQSELLLNRRFFGIGAFFQYDKQGTAQTDMAVGPKLELHFGPIYFEGGYSVMVSRAFTDRSIAKQSGTGYFVGAGVRFMMKKGGGGGGGRGGGGGKPGFYFQASFKYRLQEITKQDDATLSEPIKQMDVYPMIGIGYKF